ncbi:MAG: hypothetical protein KDJ38_12080 [Gammaproteobacteria bacterium]|nr:hypothetical protein [Gammaproteobacteria bacterium]
MADGLTDTLAVIVDGEETLLYDRSIPLPSQQRAYLDKLDARLDEGFEQAGKFVADPTLEQRAGFIAGRLFDALKAGNDPQSAASCAWLATRLPALKQLKGKSVADTAEYNMELVFDRTIEQSRQEQKIVFHSKK